jgi:uncharacterized protein YecE (DUF72 family)
VGGTLHLGTSGFAYPEWRGTFYPETLPRREMLRFYAERFNSVEINYTFRRQPAEETLSSWKAATPERFSFAVKSHRRITHWLRLDNATEAVSRFLDALQPLGPRLGPVLFQCPPRLRYDPDALDAFLTDLPSGSRYAFEFRHPSWAQARPRLTSSGIAWCLSDSDGSPVDADLRDFGPFAYLRLRRESYSDAELARWAERIRVALAGGSDVFCYFKHEEKGSGPVFAERMAALVVERGPGGGA